MKNLKIKNANKILFIENKANYIDYIQNKIKDNEFVIYHGGMYGPIKGLFFKKIYDASNEVLNELSNDDSNKASNRLSKNIEFYHWSDIDIGGFKIFARLKRIIPSLKPYKMDVESFYSKKAYWKNMSEDYRKKLLEIKKQLDYNCFDDLIDEMLKTNSKLEQEAFIG